MKQPNHQAAEELSTNLALQPSKTCFAGRDSAAAVGVSARIVAILYSDFLQTRSDIFLFCSGPKELEFGFISFVEDDGHLHPFSGWVFPESCSSNFVQGVGCGS